jgi:hypothetical protein
MTAAAEAAAERAAEGSSGDAATDGGAVLCISKGKKNDDRKKTYDSPRDDYASLGMFILVICVVG